MSQYFDMGDETLWNPSTGASRLFLRLVEAFEAELGLPSGIGPMEDDECQIDPVTLEAFLNALLAHHQRTTHAVILTFSEGFTAALLVLAQRAGVEVRWPPPDNDQEDKSQNTQGSTRPAASANNDVTAKADRLLRKARELDQFMGR